MRCKIDDLKHNLIGLKIKRSEIPDGKIQDVWGNADYPVVIVIDGISWGLYSYRPAMFAAIKNAILLRGMKEQKCDANLMI